MAELMLINPRKRRRKVKSVRKKRHKKHRMSALQRKYFGKRKQKRSPVVMAKKSRKRRRKYAVSVKRSRRYRRNPSGGKFNVKGFMQHTLMPSAIGAAGAIGIDIVMGFLPIPPQFKSGPMRTVVKIAGAGLFGVIAANFMKRETANQIAAGAITVALYDTFKSSVMQMLPPQIAMQMNEIELDEYPSLDFVNAGMNVDSDLNEYVSGGDGVGMYVGDSPTETDY